MGSPRGLTFAVVATVAIVMALMGAMGPAKIATPPRSGKVEGHLHGMPPVIPAEGGSALDRFDKSGAMQDDIEEWSFGADGVAVRASRGPSLVCVYCPDITKCKRGHRDAKLYAVCKIGKEPNAGCFTAYTGEDRGIVMQRGCGARQGEVSTDDNCQWQENMYMCFCTNRDGCNADM